MIGLDAALAQAGPRLAAWDRSAEGQGRLVIVAVGRQTATVIAKERIAPEQRAAVEQRLLDSGVLIGSTFRACDYVWVVSDEVCAVVKLDEGIVTEALGADLVITGRRVKIRDVKSVVSFVDPADIAHRGVKVKLGDGSEPVIAEEVDPTPSIDPTYGRQNLEIDAGWIVALGRDLATNFGVPHHDELWDRTTPPLVMRVDPATDNLIESLIEAYEKWDEPARVAKRKARQAAMDARNKVILDEAYIQSGQRGDAPMDVAVAKMAAYFAGRIENEVAPAGAFDVIHQPLPEIENGGYIVLELKPGDGDVRVLELRVESPSGENKASEVIRAGTTGDLLRYLRSAQLVEQVLPMMERLTEATREG